MHWQTALSQAELVEHETEAVNDSLESLDSAVDIEAIEAAITDVKKNFCLASVRMLSNWSTLQRQKQRSVS